MANTQVVVVDDDPDLCEIIEEALSEKYSVHVCHELEQAEAFVRGVSPSIVLLDVHLPGGSGLKFCEVLVSAPQPPLVFFISGDDSLELRLEAYAYGGADFLAKPFRLKELRVKVDALHSFYEGHLHLQESSEFATQTAMNAMAVASQYGEVLRFYNAMYKAECVDDIKDAFFGLMSTLQLQTSIQFRLDEVVTFDYLGGESSPLELQIYEKLAETDRMLPFLKRLMINGTYSSVIVKNMPVDDEVRDGRLRDTLATLIDGLDAKLIDLQRIGLVKHASSELGQSSERLGKVVKSHESKVTHAMSNVMTEINSSFHTLELTEQQEEFFTQLTESTLQSMEESFVLVSKETEIIDCIRLSLSEFLDNKTGE